MSCSFLGSLCGKICGTFSCSVAQSTCCDCSKSTFVVIGDASTVAARQVFEQAVQAPLALRETAFQLRQNREVRHLKPKPVPAAEIGAGQTAVPMGILAVTLNLLAKVSLNTPRATHEERWSRLSGAGALAGVDLSEKYAQKTQLTEEEYRKLEEQTQYIQEYGSGAAYLWQQLRSDAGCTLQDLEELKNRKIINGPQFEILSQALQTFGGAALSGGETFAQAAPGVKEAFLQASEQFSHSCIDAPVETSALWSDGALHEIVYEVDWKQEAPPPEASSSIAAPPPTPEED